MTALKVAVLHLLMLLPIYGEAIFDVLIWKIKGMGKDKPFSTWVVRPILFLLGGVGAWLLGIKWELGNKSWETALVMVTAFGAFFPLLMNRILKQSPCHLGESPFDKWIGKLIPQCAPRLWGAIFLYLFALCVYYAYEMLLKRYGY